EGFGSTLTREFAASVEQAAKFVRRARTAPDGAKFDITFFAARFRSRPGMAYRESGKLPAGPCQHRIAQALAIHCADLPLQVEAFENGACQLPASLHAKFLVTDRKIVEPRPAHRGGGRGYINRSLHEGGKKPRPKTKFLIKAYMLRAGGKRKQARVTNAPLFE